jgi:hypothetical protein
LLIALQTGSNELVSDFGSWHTLWGQMNRFQRLTPSSNPLMMPNHSSAIHFFVVGS